VAGSILTSPTIERAVVAHIKHHDIRAFVGIMQPEITSILAHKKRTVRDALYRLDNELHRAVCRQYDTY